MGTIILLVLVIRLVLELIPGFKEWSHRLWQRLLYKFSHRHSTTVFDNYFIDVRAFYLRQFRKVPCMAYIGNVDVNSVFTAVNEGKYGQVKSIYQRNFYNWQEEKIQFNRTIFLLEGQFIVKLSDESVEVLFGNLDYDRANKMLIDFAAFKLPEKKEDFEINIITLNDNSLCLKALPITSSDLNIDLYYNDDFIAIDAIIKQRLAKENDKGIVLLHGLPGTGKTTYLRHLIGNMNKKVMFVSPGVAHNLMNPEFMDLLIDNPNSVLVIEDAENIIMDRRYSSHSSVSNLLNISDGLLSDCLNVQIICTFNSELNMVDNALLRKGRLIAKYEFGKLSIDKARNLSRHLGLEQEINKPMTLAEITNPGEMHTPARVNVIGFRRMEELIEN